MPTILERLRHGWDAFRNNKDPTIRPSEWLSMSSYYRPDRVRLTRGNERSIVTSIYNRIATDVAAIPIKHVRVDDNGVGVVQGFQAPPQILILRVLRGGHLFKML